MQAKELEDHNIVVLIKGMGSSTHRFIPRGRFKVVRHEDTWRIHEMRIPVCKHSLDRVMICHEAYVQDITVDEDVMQNDQD